MYKVINNDGSSFGNFNYFFEAWLCAVLEHPSYAFIRGPEGVWLHPRFN